MEKWVPVYSKNSDRRSPASYCIPREKCEELVIDGCASWNKKQTVLIMNRLEAEMYRPDLSLTPGRVMNEFVDGDPLAVAIIDAYKYRYAA